MRKDAIDFRSERLGRCQILHADGAPTDFIFVCGTDAATGRADLLGASSFLTELIELAVQRQNQRRVLGNTEVVAGDRQTLVPELFDFRDESPGIEDNAVADN